MAVFFQVQVFTKLNRRLPERTSGRLQEKTMFTRCKLFILLLFLSAVVLTAEEDERTLLPIPAIFYGPETGIGGGAALLFTWPGAPQQEANQAGGILFYTQKHQLISELFAESSLGGGDYRLLASGSLRRYPDSYFGIGPDTQASAEERYTPFEGELEAGFLRRIVPAVSVGPFYRLRFSVLQETVAGEELDSGLITGSDEIRISGIGLRLRYDTREGGFAPRRGSYAEMKSSFFGAALGSSENFGRLELDARQYLPLFASQVLALQAIGDFSWGTVPFQELPRLGGGMMLRGYLRGRFRDKVYTALQAELRLPLFWRLGAVLFGAAGEVAPSLEALDFSEPKLAAGAGLRLLLNRSQGLNLRLDVALSSEGPAFYIRAMEAF